MEREGRPIVYAVVLYYGSDGEDVHVFQSEKGAEARVLERAQDCAERLGIDPPDSYEAACDLWDEHELWGSCDYRWELEATWVQP